MTPETARALLADECRKRNCAFLIDRETGELDTLGQAALAAVLAAGQAELEAVVKWLRQCAVLSNDYLDARALRVASDLIERGDHAPPAGEMGRVGK